MRGTRALALGVLLLVALALPARVEADALTFSSAALSGSFSGNFTNGNDVAYFFFELTEDSIFNASTTSGANGGFDPMLTLLSVESDSSLTLIDNNDDSPLGGPDALILDPLTDLPGRRLHAGRYALAITQTLNYFDPQRGGFSFDDDAFYACALDPEGGPCTGFINFFGTTASSLFAASYEITPVSQPAPVPEPATLTIFGTGLAGMFVRWRRRKA